MNHRKQAHSLHRLDRICSERGEVLIEAVIAFTLLLVVVVGLGQQFAVVNARLEHEKIATEVLLGPQKASLVFNEETSGFEPLSASSTPSLGEFLKDIAQFAAGRTSGSTSVAVALGYLRVNMNTGLVEGREVPNSSIPIFGRQASGCSKANADQLLSYAADQLEQMQNYTPGSGIRVPVGAKLYDVEVGGVRYQGFIDYLPFIFLWVCSEPVLGPLAITPTSTFTIVPRRLVD